MILCKVILKGKEGALQLKQDTKPWFNQVEKAADSRMH